MISDTNQQNPAPLETGEYLEICNYRLLELSKWAEHTLWPTPLVAVGWQHGR